jgi:hypothetical protein|tara:strand:+ start:14985 stop:15230 length:246 start_codon:yes stop_codon:yes gene_type:complete
VTAPMIDLDKFSAIQKASKESFYQQKKLIKKLMSGQQVLCSKCQQVIHLNLPITGEASTDNKRSSISCAKGCTDIQLDFIL